MDPISAIAPTLAEKRAHSTSPPPPSDHATSAASPPHKRAKVEIELETAPPASVTTIPAPPSTVSVPTTAGEAASASTPIVARPAQQKPQGPKHPKQNNKQRKPKKSSKPPKPGGAEETLYYDTVSLLGKDVIDALDLDEARAEAEKEWGQGKEGQTIEVEVVGLSAHGDGLALLTPSGSPHPTRLLTIPFTLPSERVLAHIHRHESAIHLSHADLVEIVRPSPERNLTEEEKASGEYAEKEELKEVRKKFGDRVKCKYFGTCSGCQYQPLSYASQLKLKQNVIHNAFANFSNLPASQVPAMGSTLPSPLQYGYRTKLTPHFQAPPSGKGGGRRKGNGQVKEGADEERKEWEVTIGFEEKGRKRIVDIEECVIATQVINDALVTERANTKANIGNFKRGATLLLRDSLPPRVDPPTDPATTPHVCITSHHASVRELVGAHEFTQLAGSFFQNNNSILPSLMSYIEAALPPRVEGEKQYLVDTYCGSGLFAVSLAGRFDEVKGVEIDKNSVKFAKENAKFNEAEGRGKVDFVAGNAEEIFATIDFPKDQTTVLIDPPRKGCDKPFIDQLIALSPACVIYVSCNPHTQARDIGMMVRDGGYVIESVLAADLFSNTYHAEGVAVLRKGKKVEEAVKVGEGVAAVTAES